MERDGAKRSQSEPERARASERASERASKGASMWTGEGANEYSPDREPSSVYTRTHNVGAHTRTYSVGAHTHTHNVGDGTIYIREPSLPARPPYLPLAYAQ